MNNVFFSASNCSNRDEWTSSVQQWGQARQDDTGNRKRKRNHIGDTGYDRISTDLYDFEDYKNKSFQTTQRVFPTHGNSIKKTLTKINKGAIDDIFQEVDRKDVVNNRKKGYTIAIIRANDGKVFYRPERCSRCREDNTLYRNGVLFASLHSLKSAMRYNSGLSFGTMKLYDPSDSSSTDANCKQLSAKGFLSQAALGSRSRRSRKC